LDFRDSNALNWQKSATGTHLTLTITVLRACSILNIDIMDAESSRMIRNDPDHSHIFQCHVSAIPHVQCQNLVEFIPKIHKNPIHSHPGPRSSTGDLQAKGLNTKCLLLKTSLQNSARMSLPYRTLLGDDSTRLGKRSGTPSDPQQAARRRHLSREGSPIRKNTFKHGHWKDLTPDMFLKTLEFDVFWCLKTSKPEVLTSIGD